jgi:RecB family endonuclease NucS
MEFLRLVQIKNISVIAIGVVNRKKDPNKITRILNVAFFSSELQESEFEEFSAIFEGIDLRDLTVEELRDTIFVQENEDVGDLRLVPTIDIAIDSPFELFLCFLANFKTVRYYSLYERRLKTYSSSEVKFPEVGRENTSYMFDVGMVISRYLYEKNPEIRIWEMRLTEGESPTVRELREILGLSIEDVSIPPVKAKQDPDDKVTEEYVEDLVMLAPHSIEEGFQVLERQKTTEAGIIDLLGKDKDGKYVVVELKRGRASDKVVGQISRYMGVIKELYGLTNDQVRGIIFCRKVTQKLKYACEIVPNLEYREFGKEG